jgi:hypothetical protein
LVAISLVPAGQVVGHRRRQQVVEAARAGPDAQRDEHHDHSAERADQAITQLHQVADERRFGSGEFVFRVVCGHRLVTSGAAA